MGFSREVLVVHDMVKEAIAMMPTLGIHSERKQDKP